MNLRELIERADAAYTAACTGDPGLVIGYHENDQLDGCDTLAQFIAREMRSMFEGGTDEQVLSDARRAMSIAADQLRETAVRL